MNNKIALNTYLSTIDSKKQSKQAEQNRNLGYRECFDGCQVGGGRGMGEKEVGLQSTHLLLWNSHGDIKYNIVDMVSNILLTMCSVR